MRRDEIGVLVTDRCLAEDVQRAAAAAARRLSEVAGDRPRALWATAAALVLDVAAARVFAQLTEAGGLPRRGGVAVVTAQAGVPELELAVRLGAARVFSLPAQVRELARFLAGQEADDGDRSRVIAVVGGHGGAGASVFAAAAALLAPSRGVDALLVDADPWGAGLDLLLGCERMPGLRWRDLALQGGQIPADALVAALPGREDQVAVLSAGDGGRISSEALLAVLEAGRRSVGVTVVDLPRRPDGTALACAEVADLVVVVTTATVRGAGSARAVAAALAGRARAARLVVRGPAPGGLTERDVEGTVGLRLLAAMRPQPGLGAALDDGGLRLRGRSPLAAAAGVLLDAVLVAGHER